MAEALAIPRSEEPSVRPDGVGPRSGARRHAWLALAGLLDVVWIFNLLTLLRYPAPLADEAFAVRRALALAQMESIWGPLRSGLAGSAGGYVTRAPVLGAWFQSVAIRAVGLSLYSTRLVSLVFGLVLLVAIYAIGARVHGARVGFLSVVLVSLSGPFLLSTHLAQYDVMVAACGFGAVALYLWDDESGLPVRSVLAGFAVVLAAAVEPTGISYCLAIGALIASDGVHAVLTSRRCRGFVGGASVSGLVFAAVRLPSPPQTFVTAPPLALGPTAAATLPVVDLFARSLLDTGRLLLDALQVAAPLAVAAVVVCVVRRSAADRTLLTLVVALLLGSTVFVPWQPRVAAILLAPGADVLVAALLVDHGRISVQSLRRAPRLRLGLATGAWMLALLSTIYGLAPLRHDALADYLATARQIQREAPPGDVVHVAPSFWFAFPRQSFAAGPAVPSDPTSRQRLSGGS